MDLNKIKHGYALISNITNYLPGKLSEDYDIFICSLRNSGAYLDAQFFTALEDSVPDKHVEDIKKINGDMLTLFHAFVLIRHQRDKDFVKDINDIFSNLAKQFK